MNWYSIRAAGSGKQELLIYGDIGESWEAESVIAKDLVEDLSSLQADEIIVRINSYGGSVSDGLAIYNALTRHPARISVEIDGVAVSIASLIAMSGDEVRMASSAMMMIHAPWGAASGNASDMREMADVLDRFALAMQPPYAKRLGEQIAKEYVSDGLDHWFSSEEALAAGLIDEISEELAMVAHYDLSRFNPPGDIFMKTNAIIKDDDKVADIEAKAAQKALAKEEERRAQIRRISDPFAHYEGMQSVINACLDDTSVDISSAREKILAKMADGVEPIAADPVANGGDSYAVYGRNDHHGDFFKGAVDALLVRGGVDVKKPHPAARDMKGMSLLQMAKTMVSQRGRTFGFDAGNPSSIIKAAMTTSDFPYLLENTAAKALQMGFENEPASHRLWTRDTEVDDFKAQSRVAISEAPALEEVNESAEYKHGSLSERAESFSLKTYGKILKISRKAIINDDLNGFTRIPRAFGASAARLEADKVYGLLTGNPNMSDGVALFHADHGNLATGSALSTSSLGVARAMMRKQKGPGGEGFLNVVPRFLIVPAALEATALSLVASEFIDLDEQAGSGTNTTSRSRALEWVRNLEVVVDPRLDETSETGWYMAGGYDQIDTIEVAYLSEQRGVFVEENQDFNTDDFQIKARLDFAAAVIDWVGLINNPGA
ncbi:MAG: ClpP-like prohead protease/major capsid protein fusion protein [Sedimenticola sp.]